MIRHVFVIGTEIVDEPPDGGTASQGRVRGIQRDEAIVMLSTVQLCETPIVGASVVFTEGETLLRIYRLIRKQEADGSGVNRRCEGSPLGNPITF